MAFSKALRGLPLRRSAKPIRIVARTSKLSRVQATIVGRGLARADPNLIVQHRWLESEGDQHTGIALAERGGKGLFTRGVEQVLLDGDSDVAVHSMKDVPSDTATPGLSLAAVPKRGPVGDVLVGPSGQPITIDELPQGAVLGTASARRAAQIRAVRPDVRAVLMRGNVPTRLEKVQAEDGVYDATLLAAAGLLRLGFRDLAGQPLGLDTMLPAAGQGALCLQCRGQDHVTVARCMPLNDPASATAIHAERELVAGLGADCHSPIAVYAHPLDPETTQAERNADSHWFRLRARVWSADGSRTATFDDQIKTLHLRRLVKRAIVSLKEQGAQQMLTDAQRQPAIEPLPT
ncbi:MAG: hydroxymethylbilane synthase [Planctomycetota bacterium]